MERTEQVHEKLKRLPKYSLTCEQKERILKKIRQKTLRKEKFRWPVPILSIVLLCALASVLVMSYKLDRPMESASQGIIAEPGEIFSHPATQQSLLGIEGKVGILGDTEFVAEDTSRVAKLMIFFWGIDQTLTGQTYKVEAINNEGKQLVLSEGVLSAPLYSEDAHILTSFAPFPTSGSWKLSFFVNEQLFEEFSMDIRKAQL